MPNRLAQETSPYLLQHANNPVDWYPWGPEALAKAVAEDKPILLSVGYSACHWCHVMEKESFEDAEIGAIMSRDYVCVKVDREERPDLDEIYMRAVQAFTGGHGGWPMTLLLTPAGEPFFGGTYFPPDRRGGQPGFREVLAHGARMYRERRDELSEVTGEILDWIRSGARMPAADDGVSGDWLAAVATASIEDFDAVNGGFGGAPKFPPYGQLAALMAHHRRSGNARSLAMVTATLDGMARGGMYDLLGGGFARYSVDGAWRVPHFEKMLYDNAQILPLYVDAWKLTGNTSYKQIIIDTVAYVLREMTQPGGGFYASQDADSEGEEGRFFAWTPRELREVLGFMDGMRAASLLGVTDEGSFEHGKSVLRLEPPLHELSEDDRAFFSMVRTRLFEARTGRVAPGRDDKIVASWNGLMISALARAGAALGEPGWVDAAAQAARFLLGPMTVDGRLRRTWKDGKAPLFAYLDDHAALLGGLIDLYEASFEQTWLTEALALADRMVALFWDTEGGAFFYTGHDAPALIARSKHLIGGAEPAGNALAALNLARLDALCVVPEHGARADRVLAAYQPLVERAPRALGYEALAAGWRQGPSAEIGLIGDETSALQAVIRGRYLPFAVVANLAPGQDTSLLPWMAERSVAKGLATAYVCEGRTCQLPVQSPEELSAQLDALLTPTRPARPTRVHAPALPTDAESWINHAPMDLESLRGQIVVLDFWTYCCINCQHVLPELAKVEARFSGQPVVVLGVHSAKFPTEKERDSVARAVARHHVSHPVVLDPRHDLWQQYAVHAWPSVIVLDADGRVAWQQSGEVESDRLATVIEDLLEEGRADGKLAAPIWHAVAAPATAGALSFPGKVAVWPDATRQALGTAAFTGDTRLYISDSGHHQIVEASLTLGEDGWPKARELRRFGNGKPGLTDGTADAQLQGPQGLARHGDTLWVADTENHAVRTIDLRSGAVKTVAGTGALGRGRGGDPSKPRTVALRSPWDIAVHIERPDGPAAAVLIAMAGAHQIWVYLPARDHVGPFIGSGVEDHTDGNPSEAALAQPSGISLFGRYLFIADSEVSSVRIVDLASQQVGTLLGQGLFDFGDIDGKGETARMQHPLGVCADGEKVYVADTFNHKIKVLSLEEGTVSTLAGGRGVLNEPGGLAVLGDFVIVADTNGHRIVAVHRQTGEIRELGVG